MKTIFYKNITFFHLAFICFTSYLRHKRNQLGCIHLYKHICQTYTRYHQRNNIHLWNKIHLTEHLRILKYYISMNYFKSKTLYITLEVVLIIHTAGRIGMNFWIKPIIHLQYINIFPNPSWITWSQQNHFTH